MKLCVDCDHYEPPYGAKLGIKGGDNCQRPIKGTDPVTGGTLTRDWPARLERRLYADGTRCGKEGAFFKPKPPGLWERFINLLNRGAIN